MTPGWQPVLPGMSYRVSEVAGGSAQVVAVLADPARFRVVVWEAYREGRKPRTVAEFAQAGQAAAAINGGFFDEEGKPLGLVVHEGKRLNPLRKADWGIFAVVRGKARIVHTREGVPRGATEALQCGPRLVIRGRVPRFKPGESFRSAVGITEGGRVMLAVTSRGQLSLHHWARVLKQWGCRNALNLDGGPSRQLYVEAGQVKLEVPGAYGVPNALGLVADR